MGVALFAGRTFRLDPESVQWSFKSKVSDVATVGGKVIQVYGTTISDMILEGSFGVGGWQQQLAFLEQMKEIGSAQAYAGRQTQGIRRNPYRFTYAPKGWDFMVYLKAYTSPQFGDKAVRHEPGIANPKWRLTLFIVEDNSGLKRVAQNAYVSRLAKGIGWKRTEFNGPFTNEALVNLLSGSPTRISGGGRRRQVDSDNEVYRGMGNQTTDVDQWAGLVLQSFPDNFDEMICIMKKESGGNPNAKNPTSTAMGLFQVMASVWAESFGIEPNHLYHPETNVRIARKVYDLQGYKAWPNTAKACGLL